MSGECGIFRRGIRGTSEIEQRLERVPEAEPYGTLLPGEELPFQVERETTQSPKEAARLECHRTVRGELCSWSRGVRGRVKVVEGREVTGSDHAGLLWPL